MAVYVKIIDELEREGFCFKQTVETSIIDPLSIHDMYSEADIPRSLPSTLR